MMIPALLQTPAALLGLRWIKHPRIIGLIGLALAMYAIRPDTGDGRFMDTGFLFRNPRIWYVPILVSLLYVGDYLLPYLSKRYSVFSKC